jgi:membrane protein
VFLKQELSLLKETYARWSDHNAPRLGASVAFYSILSFAPLLVLVTAIIGFVFGHESAHGALVSEARQLIGNRGAETVESLLKNADKPASGTFASIIAFVTLLFGASGVFTELQAALNIMWEAPKKESTGLMSMIKQRLFSFGMVLSVGFLLLVSLLLSSALAFIGHSFGQVLPVPAFVVQILNFAVSFVVVTVLFALMFKYLPDVAVAWQQVIVGAIGTALLFTIGKFLLGIYLGKASVGSTYGAAGSLVAVVVWIYYSAQIFFFGAEFTNLYADAPRKRSAPAQPPRVRQESESKAAGTESGHPVPAKRMEGVATVDMGLKIEAPVPMARPLSSPIAVYPTDIPVSVQPPIPLRQTAAESAGLEATAIETRPQRVTTPRLLLAMVIGFGLGRMTRTRVENRSDR